ncbi:YHS domain-containing (seleno)protein [Phenylobacterium sp.]|uniref:YHS domain-containing (seleno)protein n=1 Tax=Phenylobacterium sp. TaxID=1871053 RepID=UPI0025E670B2|nr:YHS domain-containing (seleno)protein [Phenylobacterium sp.]
MTSRPFNLRALAAALAIVLPVAAAASPAVAASPEIYTPPFSKLALEGYDPVAYFAGAPARGEAKFSTTHKGVQYRFSSAQNLARFQANPDAYLPQYGGYCAWAVAGGYTAKGDPLAWKIVNGKLYLNYDAKVQQRWAADIPGNIAKGDHNWPQVLK